MKNAVISIEEFKNNVVAVVDSVGVKSLEYKVSKGLGRYFSVAFNDGSVLEVIHSKLHGHVFKFGGMMISKRLNGLDFDNSNMIMSYILDSIKD